MPKGNIRKGQSAPNPRACLNCSQDGGLLDLLEVILNAAGICVEDILYSGLDLQSGHVLGQPESGSARRGRMSIPMWDEEDAEQ